MGSYVANTKEQQLEMLQEIGVDSVDALFAQIPAAMKRSALNLPEGMAELSVSRRMQDLSSKNQVFAHIFRGAGAYHHYIPAIVKSVTNKEDFVTAYTPYQAEISQGILQSIFEYQTMICTLTGMDASNASVYDGATAAAEAVSMCTDRKRTVALIAATAAPQILETIGTYCFGSDTELVVIPEKDGVTDCAALKEALNDKIACFYVQQPNFYGNLEDCAQLAQLAHAAGAKLIMGCNPISLAILKTPGEYGADIATGDGQPLGMPLSFGGPYLGFMAATAAMTRKLPGRIVGETTDIDGKRAYVLTLQAREQHIRREKASSNICSNQALCAMTAAVYLAAMGQSGLEQAARQCTAKAHYLQQKLAEAGLSLKYQQEFFHEFVTTSAHQSSQVLQALAQHGILGGLPLNAHDILWCATEMNTKEEMDKLVRIVKEVCGQ